MSQSVFDTFDMFNGTPFWAISMPNKMRDYGWTRLAWCNRQKVAVYLAAVDILELGLTNLGIFVLEPANCTWAHSVDFSELLTYFATIVRSSGAGVDFASYATYAMAKFIDTAIDEPGDSTGELFGLLYAADPKEYEIDTYYQMIRSHLKEPSPNGILRYERYTAMMANYYCAEDCVPTLEHLRYGDLYERVGFLKDIPALDAVIKDFEINFLNRKTSEKSSKNPKRETNVRKLLWNSYPHICGLCGGQISSIDEMHVDHIVPLSRGGKDILANLQLTHARCNTAKGNTLFEDSEEECQDT